MSPHLKLLDIDHPLTFEESKANWGPCLNLPEEEDEKLNKSRAFVELTEYKANAVANERHFLILAELHKLYSLRYKDTHFAVPLV